MNVGVRPGIVDSLVLTASARSRVDAGGEHRMDVVGVLGGRQCGLDVGSHCSCGWGGCGWLRAWIRMALLEQDHQTIVRPQYTMEHPILVKVTVQPALHIVMMDRRECDARPGIMWAFLAAAGSSGRSRVQVCVDCTLSPFGRQATRGTLAAQMLVAGALVVRK